MNYSSQIQISTYNTQLLFSHNLASEKDSIVEKRDKKEKSEENIIAKINSNAVGSLVQQLFWVYFQYYYSGLPVIQEKKSCSQYTSLHTTYKTNHIAIQVVFSSAHFALAIYIPIWMPLLYMVAYHHFVYFNKRSYHKNIVQMSYPMDPTDAFDIILRLIEIKEICLACVYYLFLWVLPPEWFNSSISQYNVIWNPNTHSAYI